MTSISEVPAVRIRVLNDRTLRRDGDFVVYWMIANRRLDWNFSLQQAVNHAVQLGKPLLILEALRCGYQWASDRLHRFVLQGMADNRAAASLSGARYFPYVEPESGSSSGLLHALAERACVVVTDDFPCFFLPRMLRSVGNSIPARLEAVDSNGLLPLRATETVFPTAYAFRRFLQKELTSHMLQLPEPEPLADVRLPQFDRLPRGFEKRWPEASHELLAASQPALSTLSIDHSVKPAAFPGGSRAAATTLKDFIGHRLQRYGTDRNQPDSDASSGLSPYLHFGHVSTHAVFSQILQRENWSLSRLAGGSKGSRTGWWGMSEESESFLDELITWRELGFNMCSKRDDYDKYESLPEWARLTMQRHEGDPRPHVYSLEELDAAETHDELWNAAQNQLVTEGRMHNYLRMLWGKKIYQWSATPRDALKVLIELNNRYAVDGRNPNSYSGIFWCLGRYDRAWGPERPIFGTIRYMTSENTARKLKVKNYITRYKRRSRVQKSLLD